jgi:hypothetical protein
VCRSAILSHGDGLVKARPPIFSNYCLQRKLWPGLNELASAGGRAGEDLPCRERGEPILIAWRRFVEACGAARFGEASLNKNV